MLRISTGRRGIFRPQGDAETGMPHNCTSAVRMR